MTTEIERKTWQYAFAGAGVAALDLAWRLVEGGLADSILLVDDQAPDDDPRTFGFWTDEPLDFESILLREWSTMRVFGEGEARDIDLGRWRYVSFRVADFKRFVLERLEERADVRMVDGRVDAIEEAEEGAVLEVDGRRLRANWVFDSRLDLSEWEPGGRRVDFRQSFLGWWVETDEPTFDPEVATLMDFRQTDRGDGIEFYHVLPLDAHNALVDRVAMGRQPRFEPPEDYLREVLQVQDWEVRRRERGVTPLTDAPFDRRAGRHTLRIGVAGGQLKPSTGYAFGRIRRDSEAIVDSLDTHGHPFDLPRPSRVYGFLDVVMLYVIGHYPDRLPRVFQAFFARNPVDRVLKFLDERLSLWGVFLLVCTLPPLFFIAAFFRWLAVRIGFRRLLPE